MSARAAIIALTRGERPQSGLLHNCRFEGFGAEAYGPEAIVEHFRRAGFLLADGAAVLESPRHIAIIDADRALFADIAEGGIQRIWALGDRALITPEARLSVAFDPDLAQAGGDLFFAESDHPDLDPSGASRLADIGGAMARNDAGARTRCFALRGFGDDTAGAALFALYRLDGSPARAAGFAAALACWQGDAVRIVEDAAGWEAASQARWTPRIGE